jgi:hypothetical protein
MVRRWHHRYAMSPSDKDIRSMDIGYGACNCFVLSLRSNQVGPGQVGLKAENRVFQLSIIAATALYSTQTIPTDNKGLPLHWKESLKNGPNTCLQRLDLTHSSPYL